MQRKRARKAKTMPKTTPREDIVYVRLQKVIVHLGDSCAFKHEPHKTGKGKGRPRSPSPTFSPHRKSNGDGGAQGSTPTLFGKNVLKRENWDLHLDLSRQDPKISEIQTLQYSVKDLSNGLCERKKRQGNQIGNTNDNVHKIPGSYHENRHWLFFPIPASSVSSPPMGTSKERELIHCGLRSFTSHDE